MKQIRTISLLLPALLALASCGHDAKRDNPLDPSLTPAVELAVAFDDTSGAATLTWTRYAGEAPFAAYRVLRRPQQLVDIDTLLVIHDVSQTTLLDSALSPNTPYQYRVSVVNASGYENGSAEIGIPGYGISAVTLLSTAIDGQSGSADLRWTRFAGARFDAYRVERRSADDDDFTEIARVDAVSDTSFTDSDLQPDLAYVYRIVVEAAGSDWPSNRSGREDFSLESVQLLATQPDGIDGVIRLVWTAFDGPGFEVYDVVRRVVGSDEVILLAQLAALTDTSFADETALADVAYEYSVAVSAAGQQLVSNDLEGQLTLPGVLLSEPQFDSATASATLTWTAYPGPRFESYRLQRRTAGLEYRVIAEIEDVAAISFIDSALHGNPEYSYQVTVETTHGETIPGTELLATSFHQPVTSWPLELEEGAFVRLYVEEENRLTALVSSPDRVRLLVFDTEGALLEEQVLVEHPLVEITPRSVATARLGDGQRLLSVAASMRALGAEARLHSYTSSSPFKLDLLRFAPDGQRAVQRQSLFAGIGPALLDGSEDEIGDGILLSMESVGSQLNLGLLSVDHVTVSDSQGLLLLLDSTDLRIGDDDHAIVLNGWGVFSWHPEGNFILTSESSQSWQDIRIESDILAWNDVGARLQLGVPSPESSGEHLRLLLDFVSDEISLVRVEGINTVMEVFTEPWDLRSSVIYGVGLEEVEGDVRAWVDDPTFWVEQEGARWTSMALLPGEPRTSS